MRKFVIGDIHGNLKALQQCLERSGFNYEEDMLIVIGDVVDGGKETREVVEELLKIKHLIYIIGNHDEWFMNHIKNGWAEEIWIQQGGANTLRSYGATVKEANYMTQESWIDTSELNVPVTHQDFFNQGKYYHIEDEMLFVHGGINPKKEITEQEKHTLLWDRELIQDAKNFDIPGYKKVFVGHTTTQIIIEDRTEPINYNNLWAIDCGAGWSGKLAIINIHTEEYWLSDTVQTNRGL